LEYMAKNGINMNYIKDEETHETVLIEAMKGNLVLCQMTYYDARTAIRDVIEPIMDMEEL
jgi:DNA-binding PucR family transcriptional regulator